MAAWTHQHQLVLSQQRHHTRLQQGRLAAPARAGHRHQRVPTNAVRQFLSQDLPAKEPVSVFRPEAGQTAVRTTG